MCFRKRWKMPLMLSTCAKRSVSKSDEVIEVGSDAIQAFDNHQVRRRDPWHSPIGTINEIPRLKYIARLPSRHFDILHCLYCRSAAPYAAVPYSLRAIVLQHRSTTRRATGYCYICSKLDFSTVLKPALLVGVENGQTMQLESLQASAWSLTNGKHFCVPVAGHQNSISYIILKLD